MEVKKYNNTALGSNSENTSLDALTANLVQIAKLKKGITNEIWTHEA